MINNKQLRELKTELEQLKAENERLNNAVEYYKNDGEMNANTIQVLKAENIELKSINGYAKLLKENERLKEEYKQLVENGDGMYFQIQELKADKAELLEALKLCFERVKKDGIQGMSMHKYEELKSLISKHEAK